MFSRSGLRDDSCHEQAFGQVKICYNGTTMKKLLVSHLVVGVLCLCGCSHENVRGVCATVGFEGNRPYFKINGEKRFPIFDLHGNPHVDKDVDAYLEHTGDKFGKRILAIAYRMSKDEGDFADEKLKDIGQRIERILRNHPDAEFILMPRFIFENWVRQNPDEAVGYAGTDYDPKSGDEWAGAPLRPSAASLAFRELVFRAIDALGAYVSKQPWANHVVAVRPNYGGATEWFTFCPRGYPDCGKAMTRRFRAFLKDKYGKEPAPEIGVPTPEQRSHKDMLIDPATNQMTVDFYQCMAETMADLLCAVARRTKRAFPGRLVGMYYGYVFNPWPSEAANYLLDRALACPDIDFLSNPPDYMPEVRQPGGDYGTKAIAASFRRHGKIHILEDDDRPSYVTNRAPASRCMPVGTDRAVIYRNLGSTLFDMGGYQICDPLTKSRENPYSFDNPEVIDAVSRGLDVLKDIKSLPDDSGNDVALVYNYRDKFYADCQYGNPWKGRFWNVIYLLAPYWMHRSGAAFDLLSTDDLAATSKRYRAYVFVSCFAPDEATRQVILRHTRRPGVTAAWFMAPGSVTSTGISDAPMCALTGMDLKGAGVRPAVVCTDSAAKRFETAGGGWEKTLADGSRALVFPSPPKGIADNRQLLQMLGAHFYTSEDTYVRRHGDYLMVHVGKAGSYPVTLRPDDCGKSLHELFTNRDYGKGPLTLTCDSAATWLFHLR